MVLGDKGILSERGWWSKAVACLSLLSLGMFSGVICLLASNRLILLHRDIMEVSMGGIREGSVKTTLVHLRKSSVTRACHVAVA